MIRKTAFALTAAWSLTVFAAALPPTPGGVAIHTTSGGRIYVGALGRALYTYGADQTDKSLCTGDCAKAWPPLMAPADAVPIGDWKPIARDDGQKQWALAGKPLYTYASDSEPGVASGAAVPGWQVVRYVPVAPKVAKPAGVTLQKSGDDFLLADHRGRTLYIPKTADCALACGPQWSVFRAPSVAKGFGDWDVVERGDGTAQWSYKGRPLYVYEGDGKAGDRRGEMNTAWAALAAE